MSELPKSVRDELARKQKLGTHPDADLLTAYSEGTATSGEREQIEQHLAICADCREALFLAAPEKPAEVPALADAKPRTRWFPVWAPWAAAAAILIVATFTYTRHPAPNGNAQIARTEAPTSAPAPVPAEKNAEASGRSEQGKTDSILAAKVESRDNSTHRVAEPKAKDASAPSKQINEAFRRDELKKSESLDSGPTASGVSSAARPAELATPTIAPAPSGYAARAAGNAALKPGPAAPSQNQMQNQAAQNVVIGSASQTVEVTSEAVSVQDTKVGGVVGRNALSLKQLQPAQWRLSRSGAVERAFSDSAWQPSLAKPGIKFTVVAAIGPVVWAGGTNGALFRSVDDGATWLPIALPDIAGRMISKIEFRDARHGTVVAADQHSWTTSDGGESWQQP